MARNITPERIAKIKDFEGKDGLLEFLRDELEWPLPIDADLDDLAVPYDQKELQIADSSAEKLNDGEIFRLSKLDVEEQPWSLFFIRFNSKNLPVTALRDILRGLVRKSAERPEFKADDLLFVCATEDFQQFNFAHFQTRKPAQPILETFGWHQGDAHVRTLCQFNLQRLIFKDEYGTKTSDWRTDWRSAFDVASVTKRFFDDYEVRFRAVEASVEGFEAPKGAGEAIKKELEEKRNAWTQKLFNRLLFLAFVQKKGWMKPPATAKGGSNYLESLWKDYVERKDELGASSFYRTRLQLLFKAINTSNNVRLGAINGGGIVADLIGEVPYLNGGLFDTEEDGRDDPSNLEVDDESIRAVIFDLFARYNFTVEESTPLDVQVAVDPEMLGKVFEKLILKRDRKAGGSFYTPRVIVTFMCREALKRFLGDEYAPLIERGDDSKILKNEASALLKKLKSLKVVDPACGSGAYLLGMLHELFVLHKKLDTLAEEASARDDYKRKLEIIQNNLYGVDLDDFAVHIARLRLWLSLVVEFDEKGGDKPEPLPNLDFKIEIGDSLTSPAPIPKDSDFAIFRPQIVECQKLKNEYGDYHGNEKKKKYENIVKAREDISMWLRASARGSSIDANTAESFDWLVRFGEVFLPPSDNQAGGFDIVLANPPYGSNIAENVRWNFFVRTKEGSQSKDPYGLFIARALELLRPSGCLTFIVSNTWRTLKSHKPLRKRLATSARVDHLIDLPRWIFEAVVDTGIITAVKETPSEKHQLVTADLSKLKKNDWSELEHNLEAVASQGPDAQTLDYARYTYPQALILSYDNFSFFVGSPSLCKLMSDPKFEKLSFHADVKQGVATSDNQYYLRQRSSVRSSYQILNENELLSESELAALSNKEKSDGVDPQKYGGRRFVPYDKGGESDSIGGWLPNYYVPTGYFIDWSIKARIRMKTLTVAQVKTMKGEEEKIKPNDYKTISAVIRNPHFFFRQGLTWSDAGFYSPTIRLSGNGIFDVKGSRMICTGLSNEFALAVLCSNLGKLILKVFCNHTVSTQVDDLKEMPIPKFDSQIKAKLESLTKDIVSKQKTDPRYRYDQHEQKEIDKLIYDLYGLDENDIREVELWFARRYDTLAAAQGLTSRILSEYDDHLKRAQMLRDKPYRYWSSHPWLQEIKLGEGHLIEFKQQFKHAESSCVGAVASLLNADGGVLFIGVDDLGDPVGLDRYDLKQPKTLVPDKLELQIRELLSGRLDLEPLAPLVTLSIEPVNGLHICRVEVKPSLRKPIYIEKSTLVVRDGNQKHTLVGPAAEKWLRERRSKSS